MVGGEPALKILRAEFDGAEERRQVEAAQHPRARFVEVYEKYFAVVYAFVEMGEAHGQWQSRPMQFMVYVEDTHAAHAQAMTASGALSISKPANAPCGGRTATVEDPWGNK